MKYYIYVSKLKVDMLFDQIPLGIKHKVASELKIDLKLISATLKGQANLETTMSKLSFVIKTIETGGEMGDVWNPKDYFCGSINMCWAPLSFFFDETDKEGMVMFSGAVDQELRVGLIGSKTHMLGESGPSHFVEYAEATFCRKIAAGIRERKIAEGIRELSEKEIENLHGTAYAIHEMAKFEQLRTQKVEFAAKTFLNYEDTLIGSPLYVALAKNDDRKIFGQSLLT